MLEQEQLDLQYEQREKENFHHKQVDLHGEVQVLL